MKKIAILALTALPCFVFAQKQGSTKDVERIIITNKAANNDKLTIIVDGEKITLNGKPITEDSNGNVTVRRMKIKDLDNLAETFSFELPSEGKNTYSGFGNFSVTPNKAMLGVTTQKTEKGVEVKSVTEESAAQKIGIKEGDVIIAVDGKKIQTPDELSSSIKDKNPGDKITIDYTSGDQKRSVTTALTKWKAPESLIIRKFNENGAVGGVDIQDIMENLQNAQSGQNFRFRTLPGTSIQLMTNGPKLGIKVQELETGTGVKILEVTEGSDAEKAGLKKDDIIKDANGVAIESTQDLLSQTQKSKAGSVLKLKVDRNGKNQDINVVFKKKIKTADL